jgi:hypothetical protein
MRLRVAGVLLVLPLAAGSQVPGVSLTLQCLRGDAPELRVTLKNIGAKDVNLVLGTTLGNGRSYHTDALVVRIRPRGSEASQEFGFADSVYAIAGRRDPWILPLPVRAEFSLTRPLNVLMSRSGKPFSMDRGPVDMRIELISRPEDRPRGDDGVGPGLVHVMPGELASPWIRIPEDCRR